MRKERFRLESYDTQAPYIHSSALNLGYLLSVNAIVKLNLQAVEL